MPRCFISSIRAYKIGNKESKTSKKTYDVMITRSGLTIQTMAISRKSARSSSRPFKTRRARSLKKTGKLSPKSVHHLPFVTRFKLMERAHRLRHTGMDMGIRDFLYEETRLGDHMEVEVIEEFNEHRYPMLPDNTELTAKSASEDEANLEVVDVESTILKQDGYDQHSACSVPLAPSSEYTANHEPGYRVHPNSKVFMLTQSKGDRRNMQATKTGKKPTVIRIVSAKSNMSTHKYSEQTNPVIRCKKVNGSVVLQVVPQAQKHEIYSAADTLVNMAREISDTTAEGSVKSESELGSVPSSPGSSVGMDSLSDDEDDQAGSDYQYSCMVDGSGTKIYNCLQCDKIFTMFAAFQAHAATHARQRNRCPVCKKMFSRSWLLKGHLRTHTGERPYTCPHPGCDRSFADKSNLRSHILIHTVTAKNYICDNCGRAFAQKRYLHKHRLEVCKN